VIELLKKKIMNRVVLPGNETKEAPLTVAHALAVLGSIASIEVSAGSEMASDLASGHMRLVAAISDERECVYTLEVSEPLLALAAHDLIATDMVSWEHVLNGFLAAACRSTTSVGFRGEVAGQILFLMVWEKNLSVSPARFLHFPAIPAVEYLGIMFATQLQRVHQSIRTLSDVKGVESNKLDVAVKLFTDWTKAGASKSDFWDTLSVLRYLTKKCAGVDVFEFIGNSDDVEVSHARTYLAKAEKIGVSGPSIKEVLMLYIEASKNNYLAKFKEGVDALFTVQAFKELETRLGGSVVRVNQFVKTFGKPNRRMLFQYFIRSSAIYCMENQEVVDLIIPLYDCPLRSGYVSPDSAVREENISAIVVQMRLRGEKTSDTVKNAWSTRITQLGYLNDALPVVGIFCELTGSKIQGSGLDMYPTVKITDGSAGKRKLNVTREHKGFAIFTRGLKPSDILTNTTPAVDLAFKNIISGLVDPSKSVAVPLEFRAEIPKFFATQPYSY
jgi:hypothetical protein